MQIQRPKTADHETAVDNHQLAIDTPDAVPDLGSAQSTATGASSTSASTHPLSTAAPAPEPEQNETTQLQTELLKLRTKLAHLESQYMVDKSALELAIAKVRQRIPVAATLDSPPLVKTEAKTSPQSKGATILAAIKGGTTESRLKFLKGLVAAPGYVPYAGSNKKKKSKKAKESKSKKGPGGKELKKNSALKSDENSDDEEQQFLDGVASVLACDTVEYVATCPSVNETLLQRHILFAQPPNNPREPPVYQLMHIVGYYCEGWEQPLEGPLSVCNFRCKLIVSGKTQMLNVQLLSSLYDGSGSLDTQKHWVLLETHSQSAD